MLSPTYEITTALSHTDELISPPYDIAIVTISYGRVTMSSVWDSMMSKKNMGWPFYAAVVLHWADPLPVLLHMLGAIACVCARFLLPITSGYISLQVYAAVFGLLTSSFRSLMPLIISDILGPAMIASGYGFALAFNGLGQIVGPPLAGNITENPELS